VILPLHLFSTSTDTGSGPAPTPASLVVDGGRSFQPGSSPAGDGFGSGGGSGYYVVHTDAVLTTASDATVQINLALASLGAPLGGDVASVVARQANGDPLPDWLKFDPTTGTFAGLPPDNAVASIEPDQASDSNIVTGALPPDPTLGATPPATAAKPQTITIQVLARDSKGNVAMTTFTIDLRPRTAGKQGWNIAPLGHERHAELTPELAAIEAAVRDVTRPAELFAHGTVDASPTGRAGLSEQLAGIGWRSMAAQRNALLASLQGR